MIAVNFERAAEYNIGRALKSLNQYENPGLKDIIREIEKLQDSTIFERMYAAAVAGNGKFLAGSKLTDYEKAPWNHLITRGFNDLGKFPFYIPPFSHLISFNNLNAMYSILVLVYYLDVERELGHQDLRNIYLSGLDHRIMQALDEFDQVSEVPETTDEYLYSLKSLRWESSSARNLFKQLNRLKSLVGQGRFGTRYNMGLQKAEDKFMLLLAGCSALNSDRGAVNEQDVIRAYQTYFKLINTDITGFKADNGLKKQGNGYLLCDKCGGYYLLQDGESAQDFEECSCGGKLEYNGAMDKTVFPESVDDGMVKNKWDWRIIGGGSIFTLVAMYLSGGSLLSPLIAGIIFVRKAEVNYRGGIKHGFLMGVSGMAFYQLSVPFLQNQWFKTELLPDFTAEGVFFFLFIVVVLLLIGGISGLIGGILGVFAEKLRNKVI